MILIFDFFETLAYMKHLGCFILLISFHLEKSVVK